MSKDYYYARREERRINPATGTEEVFLEVPVIVETETEVVFGKRTQPVKIGGMHLNCYFEWIPEGYYLTHKRDLEATAKREERRQRCLIPDGKGGRIMCPESHRCSECEKCLKFDFDNGRSTSLDALQESGFDAEDTEECSDFADASADPETAYIGKDIADAWGTASMVILERLAAIKPKYGLIFRELLKGVMKPSDIARNTGLKANRTCEDVPKVQALAAEMLKQVRKELDL